MPANPFQDRFAAADDADTPDGYALGAESLPQDGVPKGSVTLNRWRSEDIFPGVERTYWVYLPAQLDPTKPACLMVFQDAEFYLKPEFNAPVVFDNLIASGEMPVTVGLFVSPGKLNGESNRSVEYDTLSDAYVRLLLEQLIPEVAKSAPLAEDAASRAICGMSSGGICAFTAAWERPDAFGKVVSHCGSFANIRGGHNYPSLIRKTDRKPIRVFLQGGTNDLDVVYGNWTVANLDMAAALKFKEYDYHAVIGNGGHTLKHGAAIFPDTMRWLWRDHPAK